MVRTGKKMSQEARIHMSEAVKQRWRQMSDEDKERLILKMPSGGRGKRDTSIERSVRRVLDDLGITYIPQFKIGRYHADFLVAGFLVLECDGIYWHSRPEQVILDQRRDQRITEQGYLVHRILDHEIIQDPILAVLAALSC